MEENVDLSKYKPNRSEPRPWPTWFYISGILIIGIWFYVRDIFVTISISAGIMSIIGLIIIDIFLFKLLKYYRSSFWNYFNVVWASVFIILSLFQKMNVISL